jgi:hypothetical protein
LGEPVSHLFFQEYKAATPVDSTIPISAPKPPPDNPRISAKKKFAPETVARWQRHSYRVSGLGFRISYFPPLADNPCFIRVRSVATGFRILDFDILALLGCHARLYFILSINARRIYPILGQFE